ncbi:hypothetical protein TYM08_P2038 [Marinicellulosiphila megalodicopiae]
MKIPEGECVKSKSGSPQGGVISPVLANIYLHYALDLWFEKVVKPKIKGKAMLIRYADDFVCAFEMEEDAARFYQSLPERLRKFGLELAKEKTNLIKFSAYFPSRKHRFEFLGFAFNWCKDKKGKPRLRRRTSTKKMRASFEKYYDFIKTSRSRRLNCWLPELRRKLIGFQNYFGLPDNSRSLSTLSNFVIHSLFKWLNRRSGRKSYNWQNYMKMLEYFKIKPMRVSKKYIVVDWY